jgi:alpha-tubulin suppressor-like RCC1 family protein
VFGFGYNGYGQLGDGTTTDHHTAGSTPTEIAALGADNAEVAAGGYHSLVRKADGRVFGFGYNDNGQLGDGTTTDRGTPTEITALGADNAEVAAGYYHSLVRKVG